MSLEENPFHWTQYQSKSMRQLYVCRNRFLLLEKLGKGGFGLIYAGVDLLTGKRVAIKLEDSKLSKKRYLRLEHHIYRRCHSNWFYRPFALERNLPTVHFYGVDKDYRVLVLDLLGPSLADLFATCKHKFTPKTVCMIAVKMVTALEFLHSKGVIHRDTKPGNFVLGTAENCNALYLIDYGLSSSYIDDKGEHLPFATSVRFHGTDKYASITNHKKTTPGRRDDLESVGYLLVMFLKGDLPWSTKYKTIRRRNRRVAYGKMKASIAISDLCSGCPPAIADYFTYVESLAYADAPDYDYLRSLFLASMRSRSEVFDEVFDWSMDRDEALERGIEVAESEGEEVVKKPKESSHVNQK
eukprot:TRINITY_DN1063_c0_g1_i1.p1 TRINITY_DN1063_c0_g1~~TRINITY_DN1063_c0_g1_i1.p1  ORF type:complete len:355 (-),score=61.98 TRINITY_DN1063_c0_g1_i1:46-1110(-)